MAPPHIIVRKGLIEGRIYPRLAAHLAAFLAETLFHTSLLALPSDRFRCAPPAAPAVPACSLSPQVPSGQKPTRQGRSPATHLCLPPHAVWLLPAR